MWNVNRFNLINVVRFEWGSVVLSNEKSDRIPNESEIAKHTKTSNVIRPHELSLSLPHKPVIWKWDRLYGFWFQSRISFNKSPNSFNTLKILTRIQDMCFDPFHFPPQSHTYNFHANLKNDPQSFLINFQLFLHDNFSFSLHQRHTLSRLSKIDYCFSLAWSNVARSLCCCLFHEIDVILFS